MSPLLLILILGIIDVGQFVNVGQVVSNASREGARVAARQATTNVTDVQTAVSTYLTDMYPNLPASAVQVSVTDGSGGISLGIGGITLSAGDIASVATGSPISVQVTVQFDSVRWLDGFSFLDNRTLTKTTVTRRE